MGFKIGTKFNSPPPFWPQWFFWIVQPSNKCYTLIEYFYVKNLKIVNEKCFILLLSNNH